MNKQTGLHLNRIVGGCANYRHIGRSGTAAVSKCRIKSPHDGGYCAIKAYPRYATGICPGKLSPGNYLE